MCSVCFSNLAVQFFSIALQHSVCECCTCCVRQKWLRDAMKSMYFTVSVGLVWDSDHPSVDTTTEVASALGTAILLQDVSGWNNSYGLFPFPCCIGSWKLIFFGYCCCGCCCFQCYSIISRVPDQNVVSQAWYNNYYYGRDTPFWSGTLNMLSRSQDSRRANVKLLL